MKKIALGLVLVAGFASIAACKSQQQTYQPRPATGPTTSTPTYSGPTYTPPPPKAPAPKAACGGGKCG